MTEQKKKYRSPGCRRRHKRSIALGFLLTLFVFSMPVKTIAASSVQQEMSIPKTGLPEADIRKTGLSKADVRKITLPKIDLPKIDFSRIDQEKEKEKLRDALQELDEKGLSTEKLAERLWSFLSRPENREKIENAADGAREKAGQVFGKQEGKEDGNTGGEAGEKQTAASGDGTNGTNAADPAGSAPASGENKAADELDRIREKVTEEAGEGISRAVDEIVDKAAEEAAEKAKEAVSREIFNH